MVVVNKEAELLVKILIYNLNLAISLRVKYGKKLNFNTKDLTEFILKVQYKVRSAIKDN